MRLALHSAATGILLSVTVACRPGHAAAERAGAASDVLGTAAVINAVKVSSWSVR